MSKCLTVGVLLVLMGQRLYAQDVGGGASSVLAQLSLEIRGSRTFINVMVNGHGPFPFGWDTGASGRAWVTRALVDKLNLPIVDTLVVSDGSGVKGRQTDAARIDTVALGNLSFKQMIAPVLASDPRQGAGAEVYGTLGFELFKDYVVTFDYPKGELRVATGRLIEPDGKRGRSERRRCAMNPLSMSARSW